MPSPDPTLTHPDIPPLPPPSTFSLLPDIYLLLARLAPLHQTQQSRQSQTKTDQSQPHPQSQTQTSATPSQTQPQPHSQTPNASLTYPASLGQIPLKTLPAQIYPIKTKIQHAKDALEGLPDIDRSISEQEEETRMLEGRVRALKGRLGELGGLAGKGAREGQVEKEEKEEGESRDVVMGSTEGKGG